MAVIQIDDNTLDFIFDETINYYPEKQFTPSYNINLSDAKLYYIDLSDQYVDISSALSTANLLAIAANGTTNAFSFTLLDGTIRKYAKATTDFEANVWYYYKDKIPVKGFRLQTRGVWLPSLVAQLNKDLIPFIGGEATVNCYSIKVNGVILRHINGHAVKRIYERGLTYELIDKPTDEQHEDTTVVFTAVGDRTYEVTYGNEDADSIVEVYLNDTLIGSANSGTVVFPTTLNDAESYTLTFKGGKITIDGTWLAATNSEGTRATQVSNITEINFGQNYGSYLGEAALYKAQITSLKLPASITTVADAPVDTTKGLCAGCSYLSTVTLNEGLQSLSSYMFQLCTSLAPIVIPNTVTAIGDYCFQFSTSTASNTTTPFTQLTIPSSVHTIGTQSLWTQANSEITFMHTENDPLTFATQIFNKQKSAHAMTIKHYGNPTVLNYNYATYNITPTFVDLRETQ